MATITIPKKPVIVQLRPVPAINTTMKSDGHGAVYLTSNDYVIRSLTPDDVSETFLNWFNTTEMLSGLNIDTLHFSLERMKQFVGSFDNLGHYFLGIFHGEEIVGFYTIDVNLTHKIGSITTGIGNKNYLGKKTLWSTIDVVLDYFYANRDIHKFTARILAHNYAMLFNFKNNTRFTLESHLKRECLAPDGKRLDLLVFASHKSESESN